MASVLEHHNDRLLFIRVDAYRVVNSRDSEFEADWVPADVTNGRLFPIARLRKVLSIALDAGLLEMRIQEKVHPLSDVQELKKPFRDRAQQLRIRLLENPQRFFNSVFEEDASELLQERLVDRQNHMISRRYVAVEDLLADVDFGIRVDLKEFKIWHEFDGIYFATLPWLHSRCTSTADCTGVHCCRTLTSYPKAECLRSF